MKTEQEFEQFYKEVLEKKIAEIETLRKAVGRKILLYFVLPLGIAIVVCCFIPMLWFIMLGFPVIVQYLVPIYNYDRSAYRNAFRNSVISEMVSFINDKLTYSPDKGIQLAAIRISRLFEYQRDGEASNYVEGPLGETFIQFSEINLNFGIGFGDSLFKGIFLIASFNKYFHGDYFVFSGHHSNPYAQFTDVKKLTLEYPEFNKEFTSYGSDEVEGRYILTPAMMQRMLDFKAKVNSRVYFSFTRSRLFIAIGSHRVTLFDPSLFHATRYENLALWNKYLQLAVGVVEEFQLNTRIWSKK